MPRMYDYKSMAKYVYEQFKKQGKTKIDVFDIQVLLNSSYGVAWNTWHIMIKLNLIDKEGNLIIGETK